MDFATHFPRQHTHLEDFWGRRQNEPQHRRVLHLFDRAILVESNELDVLAAADLCAPQYSVAARPLYSPSHDLPQAGGMGHGRDDLPQAGGMGHGRDDPPQAGGMGHGRDDPATFRLQIVVQQQAQGDLPANVLDGLCYTGSGSWLMITLGAWASCFIDLTQSSAVLLLSPELARRPDLVSRGFLNTILTNFFIGSGYAMLHASCLRRGDRALLLMAPHNTGKSTTALRLVLAGYQLVSDSMIFLPPSPAAAGAGSLQLMGFPVGRVKLRADMAPAFPQCQRFLQAEPVRAEIKWVCDLRQVNPAWVCETAITPTAIALCLLTRSGGAHSTLAPAARAEVEDAVIRNSLFFDTEAVWRRNLSTLAQLLDQAQLYHLAVGADDAGLAAVIERVMAAEFTG